MNSDRLLIFGIPALVAVLVHLLFVFALVQGFWLQRKATAQVWEGARGLEWTVDSPAPEHTFSRAPMVTDKIYQYD